MTGSRRKLFVFGCFVCLIGVCFLKPVKGQTEETRIQPPTKTEIAETTKLLRSLFETQYSERSDAGKQLLGKELLKQGKETDDDPIARFTCFMEAVNLATDGKDGETAMNAVDILAREYQC